jgi:aquaporin TIP
MFGAPTRARDPSFSGLGPVPSDAASTLAVVTDPLRRGVAEFIGTFTLVFIGCGAILAGLGYQDPSLVGVALAHGLAIAVMVSAVGHISGGHFNPAITLGFLITRRLNPVLAGVYWLAQFSGALVAALLVNWIFPEELVNAGKLGTPQLAGSIASFPGLIVEVILTFFLVWVVFATAADPRGTFKSIAGLAIGLTITFDVLAGGRLTGAAMNPARAFGPELVQGVWTDWWVYWVGPLIGGGLAALVYELLYLRGPALPLVGGPESGLDEPRPGETAVS